MIAPTLIDYIFCISFLTVIFTSVYLFMKNKPKKEEVKKPKGFIHKNGQYVIDLTTI